MTRRRYDNKRITVIVSRAAIYRRYRSKDEPVAAAVAALVSEITLPGTGSTRADLLALMRDAVDVYTRSVAARAMPSLEEAMSRNPELGDAVRDSASWPGGGRRSVRCWAAASSGATWLPTSTSRARCARRAAFPKSS